MDRNSKATPTLWGWGSVASLYARSGHNPKQAPLTDWEIDHGSSPLYSYSGGGDDGGSTASGSCSGFDMGNGCSSKSAFPASMDPAVLRAGPRAMVIDFEAVPRDPTITRKELGRVEQLTETWRELLPASGGSAEPLIGLKLGKRTYFEHVCTEKNAKHISVPAIPTPSSTTLTSSKSRVSHQNLQISRCQVEGCNADLTSAKDYHRKHKVCQAHSKCPKVIVAGRESRFCQQCSRFHDLSEFDQKKRSCRRRLSDHNARRRKPPTDTIPLNPSSSFYDDRQQMNLLLNQSPFGHMKLTNSTWESSCNFKLPYIKGSWMRSTKARGIGGHLNLPNNEVSMTVSTLHHDLDSLLQFKGTTAEVLNQGLEASDSASNLDGAPDVRCAPSLLSNGSLGLADPGPTYSINQLMHVNHPGAAHTAVHVAHTRADYWQAEQPLDQVPQVLPFPSHSNSGQFHGFDLLKAPHGNTCFDINHLD